MRPRYAPTEEQQAIIERSGSAFVVACPGAGKTRTMVERAFRVLKGKNDRRGIALVSFTNAAVEELGQSLRRCGILPAPLFPSFIGTFDRFLWQFLIAPFGIPGVSALPVLIPDKSEWEIKPFPTAQSLPLNCFDRTTAKCDPNLAKQFGFDVTKRSVASHESSVKTIVRRAMDRGHIDFEDVRDFVKHRLKDVVFAKRVSAALAARFQEIVVDEAQDCNPEDIAIVEWLRKAGIALKIICDPNQSIYKFRGGVTDELLKCERTFAEGERMRMSGNFRSTPAICSAIVSLRAPHLRDNPDQACGQYKDDPTPVYLLSYPGTTIPSSIGKRFREIVEGAGISVEDSPVVASVRATASKAIGRASISDTGHKTLVLAEATMNYHYAFGAGNRRTALENLHRVLLFVGGQINSCGNYDSYVVEMDLANGSWRPEVIALANALKFRDGMVVEEWLRNARVVLQPWLAEGVNVNQRLKWSNKLASALACVPDDSLSAHTIHSVKGAEFPAICVVMTVPKAGAILDFLEGNAGNDAGEDARRIYVGASRAERVLALAVPKSRADRLLALLTCYGSSVELYEI